MKDVDSHSFNKAFSAWLKLYVHCNTAPTIMLYDSVPSLSRRSNKIKLPHYMDYVKLARYKELPPTDKDWYYVRAASVARHIYLRKGTGVGAFTKVYGGECVTQYSSS